MKITVLGTSSPAPDKKGGCSGFLLQIGDEDLLVEAGPGIFSSLRRWGEMKNLKGVLISHMHADHFLDLIPLGYYLMEHCFSDGLAKAPRVPVFLPPGGAALLNRLSELLLHHQFYFDSSISQGGAYCEMSRHEGYEDFLGFLLPSGEYDDGEILEPLPGLKVQLHRVRHPIPTFAMRFTHGAETVVYTADTVFDEELVRFAGGCDLLIADATSGEGNRKFFPSHMSIREAVRLAELAGVGRVALTHSSLSTDLAGELAGWDHGYQGQIIPAEPGLKIFP